MQMKTKLTTLTLALLLAACTPSAQSSEDYWQGWTKQAGQLYRHVDTELGVACYQSTRSGSSYNPQLSCVKVN